jgi:hypothetical protein
MTKKYFGLVCLVVLCFGMVAPAWADVSLCPNAAGINTAFSGTYTDVPGPLDSTCGANSAVTMYIPDEADYARLAWDLTGVTLGGLGGATAAVTNYVGSDQPYYMLIFTDSSNTLGQGAPTDQILMLEFQNPALTNGNTTLVLDPNATLFNLNDNTTGQYLNGGNYSGQQVTNTLNGWLASDSHLAGESLQEIRIGIGLAGGSGPSVSVTVNSLDLTTPSAVPEPTSIVLLLTVVGATWGIYRKQLRNRRS